MPNGLKVVVYFLLYLRVVRAELDLRTFRGVFVCKSVESWYYFSRRFPNKEYSLATNILTFTKNWKSRFFFVKNIGLPELELSKTGKANNLRPSRQYCYEASRLLRLPVVIDCRKVGRLVLDVADLDHLVSGPRFHALSQASLEVVGEAIASITSRNEARMRELTARRRFRPQGGRPLVAPAPPSAPHSREEVTMAPVDDAPIDLEQPLIVDPAPAVQPFSTEL